MAVAKFKINATTIQITDTITKDGEPVDFTTPGITVDFVMQKGRRKYSNRTSVTGDNEGNLLFGNPLPEDFPKFAGVWKQHWLVNFPGTGPLHFPIDSYNSVVLLYDLS